METLHKLYGRPEILISSLLKKVRNAPPPKSASAFINPMLLQELIDKLPTSLKMQWGSFKQAFVHVNLATFNNFMSGLGLPVASYINAKPGMIIGLEHVRLLTSLKNREGNSREPVATKTRLGWCVYGRNNGSEGSIEQLNVHSCEEMSNSDLHDSMRKFFAVEDAVLTKQLESEEDKRARSILEATTLSNGEKQVERFGETVAKDPELRRRVNEQIESYEQKQYVCKVSSEELEKTNPERVWFLPLGVVTNPKKPNKIRMVCDAAAKVGGVSFNDMLLKGPDLLVSLVEVLLRFREGKIAVCSDIREMFLRILLREADKWSLCFLWRSSPEDEVQVYVINVAMFGATSSPCTAQFVKNKNALDYAELYPRAVDAIINNHYVDDFLDSVNSVEEAIWRTGTNWDEPIEEQLHDLWNRWIELYETINEVEVPRYFFGNLLPEEVDEIEIHVFTDASVTACACVVYLRLSVNGGSWCSLVAAKTKVAPLRALSIPRLELQAAMMGSRLLQTVCSALTLNIRKRFLWTDSATVLAWLRSDSRRYHQFVSFWVGEILSLTNVDEWHYVPSKLNVADDATKWNSGPSFDPDNRWFQGPQFLRDTKEQLPRESAVVVAETDAASEKLRMVAVHQTADEVVVVERFSRWSRLVRTMANVHRAVRIWKQTMYGESRRPGLDRDDFVKAKETLWRQAQAHAYSEEVHELTNGHSVGKRNSLHSLVPFLDEYGVVRVGGRIGCAPHIPYAAKHPVVLPRDHRITFLLVDSFHQWFLHANGETVCNELRQEF
ncbi:uncharacterized protein LOC135702127 [Ochlerotatus camptorhynchus]|uniref:uncharacterized protein LOC135702127 n=1 Tax=Ochlerotatus camptorhynchus TaxID=644619 RepID=UPI0031D98DC3